MLRLFRKALTTKKDAIQTYQSQSCTHQSDVSLRHEEKREQVSNPIRDPKQTALNRPWSEPSRSCQNPRTDQEPSKKKSPLGCCQIPLTSVSSASHIRPQTYPLKRTCIRLDILVFRKIPAIFLGTFAMFLFAHGGSKHTHLAQLPVKRWPPESFTCYFFRQFHRNKEACRSFQTTNR